MLVLTLVISNNKNSTTKTTTNHLSVEGDLRINSKWEIFFFKVKIFLLVEETAACGGGAGKVAEV